MELKGIKKFFGLFSFFFLVLLYPVFGNAFDLKFNLEGVTVKAEKPEIDLQTIINGSYQNKAEKFLLENISGRNLMIRMHSQLLYSLFNVSSNSEIVIGKNKQLFEPQYLDYNLNIYGQLSNDEVGVWVDKLQNLQRILEENGKQLYIFITPSKARYFSDDAPEYYKYCAQEGDELAYDKFIRMLKDTDLNVFDSIEYIDTHKDFFEFPL